MNAATFSKMVNEAMSTHPRWFDVPRDESPSDEAVEHAEHALGATLPPEYSEFVKSYGGGDFAFAVVYSLDPDSELNLLKQNDVPWLVDLDFVAVSDNGCGDYLGFAIEGGRADSRVWMLDHETGELEPTEFRDLYEFLAADALHPT